jgi:Erv1 / Alr family
MTSRTNYYKTVSQVYKFNSKDDDEERLKASLIVPYEDTIPESPETNIMRSNKFDEEPTGYDNSNIKLQPNNYTRITVPDEDTIPETTEYYETECTYHNKRASNNPLVWGPPFWYVLHNGAYHYPQHSSPLHAERMKNLIIGLPVMIPCATCKEHATAFIEKHRSRLIDICSSRDSLFKFFVDFHNQVNRRYGKRVLSYEEAYSIY